jgi:DNA-binding NarL/FixJ family response regulator
MSDKKIKVLLVDDHAIVREGMRLVLGTDKEIEVTGEAENVHDAMTLVRNQDFDVALVDIGLPGKNGLELLKRLRSEQPGMAVLILSMYAEDIYALRALKLGAAGFLSKNSTASVVVGAVRMVAAGGKYVSPVTAENLAGLLGGGNMTKHQALSNRELEVLRLLARGEGLAHIANALNLSPSTITTYRARIMEKTGMKNNVHLLRYAIENELL